MSELHTEKMEEINEKLLTALSLIMIMETDLTVSRTDTTYCRAVKVIHRIIADAQKELAELV